MLDSYMTLRYEMNGDHWTGPNDSDYNWSLSAWEALTDVAI